MPSYHSDTIFGLDIGTTKVCLIAANQAKQGEIRISGFGCAESRGMRRGNITDIEEVVRAIKIAVNECAMMSGTPVKEVYVGVSGGHINLVPSEGLINISSGTVTEQDKQRVKVSAQICIESDREILHDIEQGYTLDGQTGITNPVGMRGRQLKGKFNIITGGVSAIQNMIRCCQDADLEVKDIVLQPLASSIATLGEDEKQSGVVLIDIGGGTTDIVAYKDGHVIFADVIPLGGNNVTTDIETIFNVGGSIAQNLKHEYGLALVSILQQPDKMIPLPIGSRQISKEKLVDTIESRMEEIFLFASQRLEQFLEKQPVQLNAGLVITGGGANFTGTEELANQIFKCPVRRGWPDIILGGSQEIAYSSEYVTAVGLAKYGLDNSLHIYGGSFPKHGRQLFHRVINKMRDWANEFF